tara:strand:- start:2252 stop:2755 length:504 start_codon:yes stop_codon:yes gene_type:complete
MKLLIPFLFLFAIAPQARADLRHTITSSVKLQVDAAASAAQRIGSSYSASGTNITIDADGEGGLGSLTAGSAVGYTPIGTSWGITDTNESFNFSESFTEGDATPSATSIDATAGTADLTQYGIVTTTGGGIAGDLDGSISSDHSIDITAGNAGTSATGQIISEIHIK